MTESIQHAKQMAERRYQLLVDSVTDYAIFMLDPDGRVQSWNKGAERFLGYRPEAVIGKHHDCFFIDDDIQAGRPAALLKTAVDEGHVQGEGWCEREDGTRFWAESATTALRDEDDRLVGYSVITRDLTERRSAEEQRRQLKLMVENVTDYAILMLSPEGRVMTWNRGAEALKGWREDEILGKAYEEFFLPEDVAAGKPRRLLAKARELGHIEDEGWRKRKDGSRFWALAVITAVYDERGEFIGYGKVTRDLSERKAAEEQRRQFELLIKSVTDYAILMLDTEGRIISWNKGAERLKGYSEREALGQRHAIFYTPEDQAAGKPAQLLARAAREGHVEDENWRVRKDGTRFWADVVITAVRDESGRLVGFTKITRDLTDRKRMEEVSTASALKSEFLAKMSHELRTPLNSIIGYTELVATDDRLALDELNRGNLDTVLRNARHLLALINEVLDLSKIEAGQTTVHPTSFEARMLLETALGAVRTFAEQKGLALNLHVEPGVETVETDELKVRQIALNLLSNALKFTQAGSVDVTLAPRGEAAWRVTVRDTGIGVAPEHHELIFQEFRQVNTGFTRDHGGTGLGLPISRKLAELLGGTLTMESVPGKGSTFTLDLPRRFSQAGGRA